MFLNQGWRLQSVRPKFSTWLSLWYSNTEFIFNSNNISSFLWKISWNVIFIGSWRTIFDPPFYWPWVLFHQLIVSIDRMVWKSLWLRLIIFQLLPSATLTFRALSEERFLAAGGQAAFAMSHEQVGRYWTAAV